MTTVLIVEDNLTLLEDIVLELELRGYEVLQAADGQGALNMLLASERLPDIIVSDIAMPDMDGFKLLEHLRSVPSWNAMPFLFLTAFNSPNSIRISKELGADDYIVKPFQADDLVLAMESKLNRVRAFRTQAENSLEESRRALLQIISHELRTPLTAIYGGSEILADSVAQIPDAMVHRMVNLVRNGANRLNRFTRKALVLLEVDSDSLAHTFTKNRQMHDIADIVRAAVGAISEEIAVDGRQVTFSLSTNPHPVYVDGIFEYLVMMVEELLRNAVAFTPDGGTVTLITGSNNDTVTVTVADEGPGIAEQDLPHVWERFVQIDRDYYEQQGAGLGLPVVREVARVHGGDCAIASTLDKGTQVTLSLPRSAEDDSLITVDSSAAS